MKKFTPREWKLIATDGDFSTESTKPVVVPGTRLEFELPQAAGVFFKLQAAAGYWSAMVGMRINGDALVFMHIHIHETPYGPPIHQTAFLEANHVLGAGIHSVEVIAAAVAKGPAGPKEWSPRNRGPRPKACIMKNPQTPLVLWVRAVA
jgi:hypothetical protein